MRKIIILSLFTMKLFAGETLPSAICPNVNLEAGTINNSISNLVTQIHNIPECQNVLEKLNLLTSISKEKPWKDVIRVLPQNGNIALEGEEIQKINELTEKASYAITDTIEFLSNNQNCINDKSKHKFLSNLSGVIKEVSSVIGSVSGPYGMAVSLGGNILTSAITGIDKIFKENRIYNFKNKDEELLFMNQFCSYAEIQKDINDFVNLKSRPEELKSLSKYLQVKKETISNHCVECNAYGIAYTNAEESNKILKRIGDDARVVGIELSIDKTNFTRCSEMNRAIYSTNSDLNQFFKLLTNYENPMMSDSDRSLIKDIVDGSQNLKSIYPKLTDCWSLPQNRKIEISYDFNSFLRDDILPLGQNIFGQQLETFKFLANKRFIQPLGDYIERTYSRIKWIKEEEERVRVKLKDPNFETSKQIIIANNQILEEKIINKLFSDYLSFLRKRNLKQINHFKRSYEKFVNQSIKAYSARFRISLNNLDELLLYIEKDNQFDKRIFLSSLKEKMTDLDLAISQTVTIDRYCQFSNYMLLTTRRSHEICADAKENMIKKYDELKNIDKNVSAFIVDNLKWGTQTQSYQNSRVQDFTNLLQAWLDQGDSRWEMRPIN